MHARARRDQEITTHQSGPRLHPIRLLHALAELLLRALDEEPRTGLARAEEERVGAAAAGGGRDGVEARLGLRGAVERERVGLEDLAGGGARGLRRRQWGVVA